MLDLDDLAIYQKLDTANMLGQLYGLPQQCLTAWKNALAFKLPADYQNINKVVILGMGGSAIGGDLLRSFITPMSKTIIVVIRDYELPSYVDEKTLVIASSYSGNTEETITTFSKSLKLNCKKLVLTTGGKLQEMADTAGIPVFHIEHVSPPRAALGFSFMPLLAFFRNLGLLEGIVVDIDIMVGHLKKLLENWQESIPTNMNLAKKIAQSLFGKIVVIYGAGSVAEVAHRWKTQINENSKTWAFYEILPELNHNSVVGYNFPGDLLQYLAVIFLRTYNLNPRILIRYQVTAELLQQNNINFQMVDSSGENDLSHLMSLVYLGDWISYYLAILYQIDPTPVPAIDYLKARLGGVQGHLF